MKTKGLIVLFVVIVALNVGGCIDEKRQQNSLDSNILTLYFGGDNGYLTGEIREVNNLTPQKAVEELIKGPSNTKHSATLPREVEIIDVAVEDRVAYVNFTESISNKMIGVYSSSCGSRLLLYSIVNTLILHEQFGIDKVQILIDSEKRQLLAPLAIEFPFEANMDIIQPD